MHILWFNIYSRQGIPHVDSQGDFYWSESKQLTLDMQYYLAPKYGIAWLLDCRNKLRSVDRPYAWHPVLQGPYNDLDFNLGETMKAQLRAYDSILLTLI